MTVVAVCVVAYKVLGHVNAVTLRVSYVESNY